jgi:hypothetical protein
MKIEELAPRRGYYLAHSFCRSEKTVTEEVKMWRSLLWGM